MAPEARPAGNHSHHLDGRSTSNIEADVATRDGNIIGCSKPEDDVRSESDHSTVAGNPFAPDNRHQHKYAHLDRTHSTPQRYKAVMEVVQDVRSNIEVEGEVILKSVSDMTEPEAGFESRAISLDLLHELALRPEVTSLWPLLFDLTLRTVPPSLFYRQILTIEQLIKHRQIMAYRSEKLFEFFKDALGGLFDLAEQARRESGQRRTANHMDENSTPNYRPSEEIALLKCLFLLRDLLAKEGENFEPAAIEVMIVDITGLMQKTTGQAIMKGLLEVLAEGITQLRAPPPKLEHCILLFCYVACDETSKNRDLATKTISIILKSFIEAEVLETLMQRVLAERSQSLSVKSVFLRAMAEALLQMEASDIKPDIMSKKLAALCRILDESLGAVDALCLAEPLTHIALASCMHIHRGELEMLLHIVNTIAKLDSSESNPPKVISLRLAQGLIKTFLACFHKHGTAAVIIYNMLICIARAADSVAVRLAAMKFLMRLRCDADYGIRIINEPDTQDLAATLCRTKATAVSARISTSPSSQKSAASHTSPTSKDGKSQAHIPSRTLSRSKTGPRNIRDGFRKASQDTSQPLWMYEKARKGLPVDPPHSPSTVLFAHGPETINNKQNLLDLELWLQLMVEVLRTGQDWELYSYVLVHVSSQLGNCSLFQGSVRRVSELHDLLNEQLSDSSFHDAPSDSGIRKGDTALCLYNALAMLLAYQNAVGVRQWKRVVSTFRMGIEKWDRAGKFCIHALTVCCYEIPNIISNHLNVIVEMMQKRITQSDLAVDILDFLGSLAGIPEAYDKTDFALHQKIFSICIRYLQHSREQRMEHIEAMDSAVSKGDRASGSTSTSRQSQLGCINQAQRNVHEYIFTTAYQVMIFWFLAINIRDRPRHVAWITQELAWKTGTSKEEMEPQSLVFLDMMHRTAFSDLGETYSAPQFKDPNRNVHRRTWLMGLSIVTAESLVNEETGKVECGQFTKRQASGTTHAIYYHNTEETPSHQAPGSLSSEKFNKDSFFDMYPNHTMLQLISTISPLPAPLQPIPLPDHDHFTKRLLRVFDATDTVDGHKAAVIYVGHSQSQECDILSNTRGSDAFEAFLSELGYKVELQDAKFNTQGLDRSNGSDGHYTFAWRDRVKEIVFHVPSMMPNDLTYDSTYARKKSHIGNDHVKIIFNDSGLPYDTNIFSSDFNSINIIISPEAQSGSSKYLGHTEKADAKPCNEPEPSLTDRYGYFLVRTVTSDRFPEISSAAAPKVISACGLPSFVRQLALSASVFCQVWPQESGEYTSSWLFRLQQIMKLREKHAAENSSDNVGYPQAADAGPSPHSDGERWTGTVAYGGLAEREKLISSLDFTRWTK